MLCGKWGSPRDTGTYREHRQPQLGGLLVFTRQRHSACRAAVGRRGRTPTMRPTGPASASARCCLRQPNTPCPPLATHLELPRPSSRSTPFSSRSPPSRLHTSTKSCAGARGRSQQFHPEPRAPRPPQGPPHLLAQARGLLPHVLVASAGAAGELQGLRAAPGPRPSMPAAPQGRPRSRGAHSQRGHECLLLRLPHGRQLLLPAQSCAVRTALGVPGEVAALLPAAHRSHQRVPCGEALPRARPAGRRASSVPRRCNPALPGTRGPSFPPTRHPYRPVPCTRGPSLPASRLPVHLLPASAASRSPHSRLPAHLEPPTPAPGPGAALTQVVLSLFVGLHVLPAELVLPAAHAAPAGAKHDAKPPAGPRPFEVLASPPRAAQPPAPAPGTRSRVARRDVTPRRSGILRAPPRRACTRLPVPPPRPLSAPAPCREKARTWSPSSAGATTQGPQIAFRGCGGCAVCRGRALAESAAAPRSRPAAPGLHGKRPCRAPTRLGASTRPRVWAVPRGRQHRRAGGAPGAPLHGERLCWAKLGQLGACCPSCHRPRYRWRPGIGVRGQEVSGHLEGLPELCRQALGSPSASPGMARTRAHTPTLRRATGSYTELGILSAVRPAWATAPWRGFCQNPSV